MVLSTGMFRRHVFGGFSSSLALVVALGCGAASEPPAGADATTDPAASEGAGSDGEPTSATVDPGSGGDDTGAEPLPRCTPPDGVSGSPGTIAQAVELINALPRPLSLECFIEALDRPLAITATTSTVSLQPAVGHESPRVFTFTGDLVMSIAIAGKGAALLELGEPAGENRSLKAEVEFPLDDELPIESPFERTLRPGPVSTCGVCHAYEEPAVDAPAPMAFTSEALRFRDEELVDLETLRAEWTACDKDAEPARCARLDAFFAHGDVVHQPFDPGLPTIYE